MDIETKYKLYEASVQNPAADIVFINEHYQHFFGKRPYILREDFGGTGLLSSQWAKQSENHHAYVVDLDPEPLSYGKKYHNEGTGGRLHYEQCNVLTVTESLPAKAGLPEVIVAFNFSYFIFKKRSQILEYFKSVYESLPTSGMFALDLFGGTECWLPHEEESEHETFSYFWDCDTIHPLTHECEYYIHFGLEGKKHEKVFAYDWRHWSLPELVDLLEEAGFTSIHRYWEGEDGEGGGDGSFFEVSPEKDFIQWKDIMECEAWVTYLVALK